MNGRLLMFVFQNKRKTPADKMPKKYNYDITDVENTVKVSCSEMRLSFKNTTQTVNAIRNMTLPKAIQYMKDVMDRKRCVPFRFSNHGVGKCAQAKEWGITQGRWPEKSCKLVLGLLKNAESNAEGKGIDPSTLVVKHSQANSGRQFRRRMYRAHGRINPRNGTTCHVEIVLKVKSIIEEEAIEGTKKMELVE